MRTEKIYKAKHNHPFLKEGLSIQIVESSRVYTWKNNQWTFTHIESKGDFDFWSLHKDSFGNICPNLEHWQLVKENKDFEIGNFYKFSDSYKTYIFQIRQKYNVGGSIRCVVNMDSSIFYNDGVLDDDCDVYNDAVEATKEDIEYCLKEKAKEKGLDKFKVVRYIDNGVRVMIEDYADNFYLMIDYFGIYQLSDGYCFLWRENEGWLVGPEKEPEYIKTQEGEKKHKGDIVYIVKDNYEVKRVKLVDDGEGDEKINDKKIFSEWHNAMEYRIKKLKDSKDGIVIYERELCSDPNNGFTVIDDFGNLDEEKLMENRYNQSDINKVKGNIHERMLELYGYSMKTLGYIDEIKTIIDNTLKNK